MNFIVAKSFNSGGMGGVPPMERSVAAVQTHAYIFDFRGVLISHKLKSIPRSVRHDFISLVVLP
jgi:hypothetical protein